MDEVVYVNNSGPLNISEPKNDPFELLGVDRAQRELWARGKQKGLIEVAPVHLPRNPPGDCSDAGKTWSKPYDLRDCMKSEDRLRGGIVPLSHRAKFDKGNKSALGYKVHLHAIGTAHDGAVLAVNNHGVFRSEDAGRSWKHFSKALREDTFNHPIINIGPRILNDSKHGLLVFGNWFGEVDQYHQYSEKLVVLRSTDGGATWKAEEYPAGFKQYEPAALFRDGQYLFVTRDQNQVRAHRQMSWIPGQKPTITQTNLQDPA